MTLHEEIGDHRLQDHHGQDDDQQRARIEPLGQEVRHPPREILPAGPQALQGEGVGGEGRMFAHLSTTSL
jgi:hypothetical protein